MFDGHKPFIEVTSAARRGQIGSVVTNHGEAAYSTIIFGMNFIHHHILIHGHCAMKTLFRTLMILGADSRLNSLTSDY